MDSPPSRPLPTETPTAGGNELDDLFDYDFDDPNDPFSENYVAPGSKGKSDKEATEKSKDGAGLGIDEEIEITKKPRVPRVKLDEHKLVFSCEGPCSLELTILKIIIGCGHTQVTKTSCGSFEV